MYEIWTKGAIPYQHLETNQKVWVEVTAGYRLPCPDGCPADVYTLMTQCWNADSELRPGFDVLAHALRQLEREYSSSDGDSIPRTRVTSSSGPRSPRVQTVDTEEYYTVQQSRNSTTDRQFVYQQLSPASAGATGPNEEMIEELLHAVVFVNPTVQNVDVRSQIQSEAHLRLDSISSESVSTRAPEHQDECVTVSTSVMGFSEV